MENELSYPFNAALILKKKKGIRRELLEHQKFTQEKNIAILGGSTTNEIKDILELFLMDQGIKPHFYMSEYNKYWEDIVFANPDLENFHPDIIYIHTSTRNITEFPTIESSEAEINECLNREYGHFEVLWERASEIYNCPIIQNNFEQPYYRLLGNREVWDIHGKINYIAKLNDRLYAYAREHDKCGL